MFVDLLGQHFVHTALLAGAVVAVVAGAIGVFVVTRGASFAVHAISELGFTGAAGALVVHETGPAGYPWGVLKGSNTGEQFDLVRADKGRSRCAIEGWITREQAVKLFKMAGKDFDALKKAAISRDFHPVPLDVNAELTLHNKIRTIDSYNVVGKLTGSDPKLKDQYVIYTAHWDHFGNKNGQIFHGADDNGSGVSALIEMARAFKAPAKTPRRTMLFMSVTAEEQGELGSIYFAHHPTVPIRRIVADINMDMFLPLFPLKYLEVQGLEESTLGDDIRAVCKANGVIVQADKVPSANRFIRSDQYSFVKMGVPALAFKFGWTFGSLQEKIFNNWIQTRYHSPSDDLEQTPVDKAAAARFDHILEMLALRVANEKARPAWEANSFFRRFAAQPD